MKNCCTDTGPEPKKISAAEVGRTLQTRIDGADVARTAQLGGLQTLRQVKGASLTREQTRLSATLGPQHPRVLALSQKVAVNQNLAVQVQRAQSRAQASAPQADANAWIVHGHVRTKELKPVPQATVALYTCDGQWLRQFGYACTDAGGYFKLIAKAAAHDTGYDTAPAGNAAGDATGAGAVETKAMRAEFAAAQTSADVKSAQPAPDIAGQQASYTDSLQAGIRASSLGTTASRQICLNVTDGKQQFLGSATGALTPRLGAVDYREIILDDEVCTPPPGGSSDTWPQGDPGTIGKTQFLGNSHNREVHDLKNTKTGCHIDQMSADHRVFFRTAEDAIKVGYDYCAYCFGKDKSKR